MDKVELLKNVDSTKKRRKKKNLLNLVYTQAESTFIKNQNALIKSYVNIESSRKLLKTFSYNTVDNVALKLIKSI